MSKAVYGPDYLPGAPREYTSQGEERAGGARGDPPDRRRAARRTAWRRILNPDQRRLYELIWKRAVASQMQSAELDQVTRRGDRRQGPEAARHRLDRRVRRLPEAVSRRHTTTPRREDEDSRMLPPMAERDPLKPRRRSTPLQHFTQPPPRYSEASLVKKMEELGIGRPSTYASILSVLQDRKYVRLDKRRFIPEDRGRLVTAFLISFFEHYVDTGFTAAMEEKLDDIAGGQCRLARGDARLLGRVLQGGRADQGPEDQRRDRPRWTRIWGRISSRRARTASDPRACPACGNGRLGLKLGRYGSFIGCSNYPACQYTRRLAIETGDDAGRDAEGRACACWASIRRPARRSPSGAGPYGLYVQQGEASEDKKAPKPRRTSLPRGMDGDQITLEQAIGAAVAAAGGRRRIRRRRRPIEAGIGRFGPYRADGRGLRLAGPRRRRAGGRASTARWICWPRRWRACARWGRIPTDKEPVAVRKGRFGPYRAARQRRWPTCRAA